MGDQKSMMVIGGQWGDEGKGKVVDLLSGSFLAVVRYNGGHNAGHTVRVGERKFALHLVPSGIIHPQTRCYMGAGLVIDPTALLTEIDRLSDERQTFPWEDGLPPAIAASLDPYAEPLAQLYCEGIAKIELMQKNKGLSIRN